MEAINWTLIFYICFSLGVLIVLDKVLGVSFRAFFREFRLLLRRGPMSRAKLNAILVIILGAACTFYFLVQPIRDLIDLIKVTRGDATSDDYLFVISLFVIGIMGLLSVRSS